MSPATSLVVEAELFATSMFQWCPQWGEVQVVPCNTNKGGCTEDMEGAEMTHSFWDTDCLCIWWWYWCDIVNIGAGIFMYSRYCDMSMWLHLLYSTACIELPLIFPSLYKWWRKWTPIIMACFLLCESFLPRDMVSTRFCTLQKTYIQPLTAPRTQKITILLANLPGRVL